MVRRKGLETLRSRSVQPSRAALVRAAFHCSSPTGQNKKPDTRMGIWLFGTPKGTRTPDLLIRSQSLYPTELSAHVLAT